MTKVPYKCGDLEVSYLIETVSRHYRSAYNIAFHYILTKSVIFSIFIGSYSIKLSS